MVTNLLTKIFGSKNDRELRRLQPVVDRINELEKTVAAMDDTVLPRQTLRLRERLEKGAGIDEVLPEAFATVREASRRTLAMRHFDAQLIGGVVLHQGCIAEMKTGEGKTLAATLPAYLNALTGRGVHIVTVNDYLAKRDTEWMGQVYRFLGLTVGCIVHGLDDGERRAVYAADITYGTNNEFGFDYLRDNMKFYRGSLVQRDLHYAIVDEVDSILIDEARTPLIISGPGQKPAHLYYQVNSIIPGLQRDRDYTIDEKARSVVLTDAGIANAEKRLGIDNLYDPQCIDLLHHINQGLKAHTLFKRDVDYIVKNGEVVIVDEFTGRLMPGRRYSEGLHQALEAKENVKIESENQTLASITFQNFFRMYDKLAGMTGTADTEAAEFKKIYDLDVMVIPTNKPMVRSDYPDVIYKTRREKFEAAIEEIVALHAQGQPVLVGTVNIDVSESFSRQLKKRGIQHAVLNAKNHQKEAEIISAAGQRGAVTISTNMAGRGTDIVLGEDVPALGGLHILGTERHESRRIDNQLRGRAGRQGDPGSSRFYLALEDDLLRIFGGERITGIMERLGMQEGEPIEHKLISRAIENAQSKVEGHNFEIRKQLLEYDDVMNQQREVIYQYRRDALLGQDLSDTIAQLRRETIQALVATHAVEGAAPDEWDLEVLSQAVFKQFNLDPAWPDPATLAEMNAADVATLIHDQSVETYAARQQMVGRQQFGELERMVMLQTVDNLWKDHLLSMDHLKEGIGLRGYAQQNPLLLYKKEGFDMFQDMIARIGEETLAILHRIQIEAPEPIDTYRQPAEQQLVFSHGDGGGGVKRQPARRASQKIGRNDPCPCGSGKKYKRCCGR